jgi:hypothetical protein
MLCPSLMLTTETISHRNFNGPMADYAAKLERMKGVCLVPDLEKEALQMRAGSSPT